MYGMSRAQLLSCGLDFANKKDRGDHRKKVSVGCHPIIVSSRVKSVPRLFLVR
jgi:hypothetical protein